MEVWSKGRYIINRVRSGVKITAEEGVYLADNGDRQWYLPYDDYSQATWCLNFADTHERYVDHLNEGDTLIEVGAATGEYTTEAAHQIGPQGQLHAIEAEPQNYKCLNLNLASEGVEKYVHTENIACSDGTQDELLFAATEGKIAEHRVIDPDVTTEENQYEDVVGDAIDNPAQTISVPAVTIDEYANEHIIEDVDVLKVTVNGHEATVLNGAKETLANTRTVFINHPYEEAVETLEDAGFELELEGTHDALGTPQLWRNKNQ